MSSGATCSAGRAKKDGGKAGREGLRSAAGTAFADQHSDLIQSLRNKGRTLREICDVLNDAGIKTPKGDVFLPVQVTRILRRSPNPALAA